MLQAKSHFCAARPNLRIPAPRRGECPRLYNLCALKNRGQRARALKSRKIAVRAIARDFCELESAEATVYIVICLFVFRVRE